MGWGLRGMTEERSRVLDEQTTKKSMKPKQQPYDSGLGLPLLFFGVIGLEDCRRFLC
jgi:hypothetical protein